MKRPAKHFSAIPGAAILAVLLLSFAHPVFGDTKPKFVYVANSGDSFPGDQVVTFQVTATATCTSSPCSSTLNISGSLMLDLTLGQIDGNTLYLTDSSDLALSPLPLYIVPQRGVYPPTSPTTLPISFTAGGLDYQGNFLQTTNFTLYFPFTSFPGNYSGGPLCTSVSAPACAGVSGFTIVAADMSPSLRATTGGNPITGTITSGSLTVVPNTQGSNTISGYAIDATTGALTPLPGSPFTVGLNPDSLVIDPSNKFLYVANRVSDDISAFVVNSSTGALTPITGSPFPAGSEPDNMVVDPSGKHVYVANQRSGDVWVYTIDSETGTLTPINGSPFSVGSSPASLIVDPLDRFLYVMNYDRNQVYCNSSAYSIDTVTGALSLLSGVQYPGEPCTFAGVEDPLGKFFFGIDYDFNVHWGVYTDAVNGATGALTPAGYSNVDNYPSAVAVHPSGKFLYITDNKSSYVAAYTIDSTTGNLAIIPGSPYGDSCTYGPCAPAGPYATGSQPESIAIDPSGKFAYVGNMYSNNISGFSIDATTGAMAPIPGSPFAAGMGPASVAIVSSSTTPFNIFKAKLDIDEDRKTKFDVGGFFTLGQGSDGIYPLSEAVTLQVGSVTVMIPAGSFKERGRHEFVYEGRIDDVEVKMVIFGIFGNDYFFGAEGKGDILSGIANPVTVGLAIGDDEGSATVKADIDK